MGLGLFPFPVPYFELTEKAKEVRHRLIYSCDSNTVLDSVGSGLFPFPVPYLNLHRRLRRKGIGPMEWFQKGC